MCVRVNINRFSQLYGSVSVTPVGSTNSFPKDILRVIPQQSLVHSVCGYWKLFPLMWNWFFERMLFPSNSSHFFEFFLNSFPLSTLFPLFCRLIFSPVSRPSSIKWMISRFPLFHSCIVPTSLVIYSRLDWTLWTCRKRLHAEAGWHGGKVSGDEKMDDGKIL